VGVAKFVGDEIADGRDATIEIKNDRFKDFSMNVKIDSKVVASLEIIPLFPIKLTFVDD
jgi:hypothetical protein